MNTAIAVPAITLEGDANGAPHSDATAYASKAIIDVDSG
jgi:hypothetical protein